MAAYDSKSVNVIVKGSIITGYAEGDMVTCERNEDRISPYVGAKGETSFALNNNNSGKITVVIQQNSPSNRILSALAKAGKPFDIKVSDSNDGGFRAGGNQCVIIKEPPIARGKEIKDRSWEFWVADYTSDE